MQQDERFALNITELTRRLDDHAMRLLTLEIQQKGYDAKVEEIKEEIRGFRRAIFWLNTLIVGGFITALIKFIIDGGLAPAAKAVGF